MFTKLFWKDVVERLVATVAQVALGLLSADAVTGVSLEAWLVTLGVAALGVVLKALAALKLSPDAVSPASFAPASPDLPAVSEEVVEGLSGA